VSRSTLLRSTLHGAALSALLLAGCVPEFMAEDGAVTTSVETAPAETAPAEEPSDASALAKMSADTGLNLVPDALPASDTHQLAVSVGGEGPNVVLIEATYAASSPQPRAVLPGGASVLSQAHTEGRSIWRVRPPVKGSHSYGAEISDGDALSTMSASCCASPRYADPVLPPAPGEPSVDQVNLAR